MNRFVISRLIITGILTFLLMASCDKAITPPIMGGTTVSEISARGATIISHIHWDGDSEITECGFCYNTTGKPDLDDKSVISEAVKGKITWRPYTLEGGTKYYVKSYAKNKSGTGYGWQTNFTTKPNTTPAINSPYIMFVSHNTVICNGGYASVDNLYDILSRGVCWSTSKNPTINDSKQELGSGAGGLGCVIEGLNPATVYYIRSYATNAIGISYGENKVIKTYDGYMTDFEGHIYSTVRLGKQEWMNRNLETRYFSNGDMIKTTGTVTINIEQEEKPIYQWAFSGHEDHPELLDDDGRLYTWYAATDSRKICPAGWHLPSTDEWNELIIHLGGNFRQTYNFNWESQLNIVGAEGGFRVQLAGFRYANGQFPYGSNYGTYWWSATEASSTNAFSIFCRPANFEKAVQSDDNKKNGFSVRCIKN